MPSPLHGMLPLHLCSLKSHSHLEARLKSFPSMKCSGLIILWSDLPLLQNPKKICITFKRFITLYHSSSFLGNYHNVNFASFLISYTQFKATWPMFIVESSIVLLQSLDSRNYLFKQWINKVLISLPLRKIENTHNIKIKVRLYWYFIEHVNVLPLGQALLSILWHIRHAIKIGLPHIF